MRVTKEQVQSIMAHKVARAVVANAWWHGIATGWAGGVATFVALSLIFGVRL